MSTVINLYGGAGIGKSTLAADIFRLLKQRGYNAELVPEYVKKWAWEGRSITPYDQLYILGKQSQMESVLYGKVDYIVAESPLLLAPIYERFYGGRDIIKDAALNFYHLAEEQGVMFVNYILSRQVPYKPEGRYENERVARQVDDYIAEWLRANNIPARHLVGDINVWPVVIVGEVTRLRAA